MRKIREILRLKYEAKLTNRQIAQSCKLARSTIATYLERAEKAGLGWPLPDELAEDQLHEQLFPDTLPFTPPRPLPDLAYVHKELRRRHVTLQLLWEEYLSENPDGYGYTQFCEHYKRWKAPLEVTLRQRHIAGEKTFLDWAGKTLSWTNPETGHEQPAYLFVGVLGASNYTFAEAFADQQLGAWIEAHIHMAQFYGGVTRLWVPDNAKTGVVKPCYYEPQIHDTYQELADHYGTAILPTRTYTPKDKAKVENAVLHAERRILARLRDQTFFSLGAINTAIRQCLQELNERPFQKMAGSRLELYNELDQPALHPLPSHRYQLGEWRQAKVNIDYHAQTDWHYYSVPYQLTQQLIEVRLAARTVELFHNGRRVAAHPRSRVKGGFTTDPAHRPKAHEKHLDWTPGRLIDWGRTVGPLCAQAVTHILDNKPHPEQGYRACLGIMRLSKGYGAQRMEAEATEALKYAQFLSHEPKLPRDQLRDLVSAREILFELDTIFREGLAARGIALGKIFRESPDPCRVVFDSMPSFDVAVTLKTSYHRDANHRWKHNDIYDINALAGTVPYCDIVLTDKEAMSHAKRTGLPERLNTVMLARLTDLPEHL